MKQLDIILLIDDDFATNYLHKKIISKSGIDIPIEVANDGEEGINKLLSLNESINNENATILVFLDLNMPVMDGWGFLKQFAIIRSTVLCNVDLYVLSSSINPDDKARATSNSLVIDYYPKPLSIATLKNIRSNYL